MGTYTVGDDNFLKTRTIRRELDVPPKTLQNRDVLDERTGMYSQRVLGGTSNFRRILYAQDVRYFAKEHMDVRREALKVCTACQIPILQRTVLNERRATGTFTLGHAASSSLRRSVANIPVGSRSQGEGTRIPALL